MKLLKVAGSVFFIMLISNQVITHASVQENPIVKECEYVLAAGGVSDGEYIWTIPYETGSFAKISVKTGKNENLSVYASSKELAELSGYKTGALHESEGGEKFLYLAPYEVEKPLVRINLNNLKIDYPFRNIGYNFGSSQITKNNGTDYLWLFPSKVKPNEADTEIVKLNLTEGKKEAPISTKINKKYYSFTSTVKTNENIWLLPSEDGQPLIRMDTNAVRGTLESEGAKKIYSWNNMNFSKITTAVNDGNCIWFLCENISFMLNNCVLVKCDQDGNFIDKIELSKDRYTNATACGDEIYLFAGAEGKKPFGVRINAETGKQTSFRLNEKKGYIPSEVFSINEGKSGIYVLPRTIDGKKMPILRVIERPTLKASVTSEGKAYRDYGDLSKGCGIGLTFSTPEGFRAKELYWFISDESLESVEKEAFFERFEDIESSFKNSEKIKSLNNIIILANRNGMYNFLIEFVSDDNETTIHATCAQNIDNIYERIPLKITRYNIKEWNDGSVIETVTHLKDFGAAFSSSGDEFIKCDPPMELVPAKEVFAKDELWELRSPASYVISLGDEAITPDNFCAEFDFAYESKSSEPLDENLETDNKKEQCIGTITNLRGTHDDENNQFYIQSGERAVMEASYISGFNESNLEERNEVSKEIIHELSASENSDNELEE